jgi:hypothetical protein
MQTSKKQEKLSERYRNLYSRSKKLILSPQQEWSIIFKEKNDINTILATFIFPYIALITAFSFSSYLLSNKEIPYTIALKQATFQFTSLFLSLLVTYFITYKIIPKFVVKTASNNIKLLAFKLAAYSSVIIYLVKILSFLIPQTTIIYLLSFYTGYLVWSGTKHIGKFENKDVQIVFTVIVSTLLLFTPFMIIKALLQFSTI